MKIKEIAESSKISIRKEEIKEDVEKESLPYACAGEAQKKACTENPRKPKKNSKNWLRELRGFMFIWLIGLILRIYRVERGNFVLWDEAHFGKFCTYYLKREFFFDVHPPLGKMLCALSGYIFRISKEFLFESEEIYPSSVDYVGMRIFNGVFGSLLAPLLFSTLRSLNFSYVCSWCISMSFAWDNALIAISRIVLLDSFLLFFILLTELFFSRSLIRGNTSSSSLLLLGVSMGLSMSVKWIAFLTVGHVAIYSIFLFLVEIRKNKKKGIILFFRFFFLLVFIPLLIYCLVFYVHFLVLNRSGTGDGDMSSLFQSSLIGNEILKNDKNSSYGNTVTIRSSIPGAGLLHSHVDKYPSGEQQITTYPHKDTNNYWKVLFVGTDPGTLQMNDELVLFHVETNKYLAIEDKPGYITRGKLPVCFSQEEMEGNILSKCVFSLESSSKEILPVSSSFYLYNKANRCYLSSSSKKLPKWGHKQGEVICVEEKRLSTPWNIEMNREALLDRNASSPSPVGVKQFFKHLLEINWTMHLVNNSLVDDGASSSGSLPYEWIFPKKWLKFNRWDGSVPRFALIGNPFTWYLGSLNTFILIAYSIAQIFTKNRKRRNRRLYMVVGGWLLHYLPFFLISRILYLHHYLSALIFSYIGLSYLLNSSKALCYIYLSLSFSFFLLFSSVTYGYLGDLSNLPGYHILTSWNIYHMN
ncbi:dolichyl-phosphate-mannose-protein mannosyltransferase [Nematocida sp. LUAm3]|nr:dolichyl-phosphate-mannose-protein mannosyltransferase [Nematocida sp. LUAm3]KAI5173976.1 dolichyl-phosphate-mannose-protein mannosyltransferase [Nematocida sp. LUAm2]KAI5177279.1 dolichyl-phosphate-mannose-protein mannosyltransferase [Nematocida sp. LUAm1]